MERGELRDLWAVTVEAICLYFSWSNGQNQKHSAPPSAALLSVHLAVSITMCRLVFAASSRQAGDPQGVSLLDIQELCVFWALCLCLFYSHSSSLDSSALASLCLCSDCTAMGLLFWRNWMQLCSSVHSMSCPRRCHVFFFQFILGFEQVLLEEV